MKLYAEFRKIDKERRMVWGYASTDTIDSHGEIVTRDALVAALPDYLKFANVREMHQPSAVGVTREAEVDDRGLYIGAHIVDQPAWVKVQAEVYKGFSIGGHVHSRDPRNRNVITGIRLSEISLVDRPANPEAVFDVWKADGLKDGAATPASPPAVGAIGHVSGDGALTKLAGEIDTLSRTLAKMSVAHDALAARIAALEAQPLPPKGVLKVVPKEADDLHKSDLDGGEPKTALDAIKKALRNPQPFFGPLSG